jgi:hypothetical protein
MIQPSLEAVCHVCERPFLRMNTFQVVCGVRCARKVPAIKRKAERAADKAKREKLKPRGKWLKEAQAAFNAWIRLRDAEIGCISCGTLNGKRNAGHYLSTAARPELRFDEDNVHLQCERCNTYLHGNLIAYRVALLARIGVDGVARLEGPWPVRKYRVDELRVIRDDYRARVKKALDGGAQ